MQVRINLPDPPRFFLLVALTAGLLFAFITPPFQSPDEYSHYCRAMMISRGQFLAIKENQRLGGYLPGSVAAARNPFRQLTFNKDNRIHPSLILTNLHQEKIAGEEVFVDLPFIGLYPPVPYLPQAAVMATFSSLGAGPLALLYICRLVGLLIWIASVWLAIRISPVFKWLMVVLALLPMSLFIHSAISGDTLTNALAFLILALALRQNNQKEEPALKSYIPSILLASLLALTKFVYAPLVLLFLPGLYRTAKLQTPLRTLLLLVLFIVPFFAALGSSQLVKQKYLSWAEYNPNQRDTITLSEKADVRQQTELLMQDPLRIPGLLIRSVYVESGNIFRSYIGIFGWYDRALPGWMIITFWLVVIGTILSGSHGATTAGFSYRLILLSLALLLLSLVFLSQYLSWNPVGSKTASIQGRYLVPVFPLLMLGLAPANCLRILTGKLPFILLIHLLLLSISLVFLASSYYSLAVLKPAGCLPVQSYDGQIKQEFTLAEGIQVLPLGEYQKELQIQYPPDSVVELSNTRPFGFSCKLAGINPGERVTLRVKRKGKEGGLVISDADANRFYQAANIVKPRDSANWSELELSVVLPYKPSDLKVQAYVYNPGRSSLFKDFSLCVDTFLHGRKLSLSHSK